MIGTFGTTAFGLADSLGSDDGGGGTEEPEPSAGTGGSWYSLLSILQEGRTSARQDAQRQMLACPNDGEPYRTGPHGVRFCPYCGYQP